MRKTDFRFILLSAILFIVFSAGAVSYYKKTVQEDKRSISEVDFSVYYLAGYRLSQNENIYDVNDGYFIYKYAPIFAVITSIVRFSSASAAGALLTWYVLLFISCLIVMYIARELLFGSGIFGRPRFFDIAPLLFISRYVILVNFIRPYRPSDWPFIIGVFDKLLIFVIAPIYLLNLFFRAKDDASSGRRPFAENYFIILSLVILFEARFFLSNLDRAQANLVILLLLSLFVYYLVNKRDIQSGLYLGIAVIFKVMPAIFLIYLVLKKRYAAFISSIVTFFALLFIPSLKVGFSRNIDLIKGWLNALALTFPAEYLQYKNQSLMAVISRFFSKNSGIAVAHLDQGALSLLIALCYAIFLILLIYVTAKKSEPGKNPLEELYNISLFFMFMIILSPVGTKTTFVHSTIPIALLIREAFKRNLKDRILNSGLILYVFIVYVNSSEVIGDYSTLLNTYSLMSACLFMIIALLIYAKFSRYPVTNENS